MMAGLPKMKKNRESCLFNEANRRRYRTTILGFGFFIALILILFLGGNQIFAWNENVDLGVENSLSLWGFNEINDYRSEGSFYVNNNTFYETFLFADSKTRGRIELSKSPQRGTSGLLLGTDFKINDKPFTNSSIGFKLNLTDDNPLLEKAMLVNLNARWMPYCNFYGFDMGLNLTARGGVLNITTETQPVNPPYPSQILAGTEAGISVAKALGILSLGGEFSQYITYSQYASLRNIDNSGKKANFATQLKFVPFVIGAKWQGKEVVYNPDKYFFLDTMEENQYTLHLSFLKKNFDIGVFHSLYDREGLEFTQKKLLTGVGLGLYGWAFKGLLAKNIIGVFDSLTFSIGKSFDGVKVEAYWTCENNVSQTLNNNTIGIFFSYGLSREQLPTARPGSYKNYIPYDRGPFNQVPNFLSLKDAVQNLDSLSKVIRYTRTNIDYVYQEEKDRTPSEVFNLRGGDCDEQVFFQHYILNNHKFGEIYEIGFQSPRMCHAFSYGKDEKTGEEYIWEYGRVFKLKFKDDKLSLREKVTSILSNRSYSKDWEWFVTYGPELNYENFYDNNVIAAEGFRTAPDMFIEDGEILGIIPESGIQLFIGDEFEK